MWAFAHLFTNQKGKNLPDIVTEWQHESKRNYSVNSLWGLLLQQGHFASIGNKSIMIYSLMWGWCSLIHTSTAWRRLWLHWNPRFIDFCGWTPMEKCHSDKIFKNGLCLFLISSPCWESDLFSGKYWEDRPSKYQFIFWYTFLPCAHLHVTFCVSKL